MNADDQNLPNSIDPASSVPKSPSTEVIRKLIDPNLIASTKLESPGVVDRPVKILEGTGQASEPDADEVVVVRKLIVPNHEQND